ncbi:MAG: Unknown protein [uncultured Sulfurovum sp.]|uniref:Sulfatase N-terminal domain-containing protein n=1 Tax=uncultured Sulfurovum sp. TaxID=269237 RepID=A0A6S6TNP3_9BACT|nr:MAG: Unknown protein [uncultured Sulfurovum sp.]
MKTINIKNALFICILLLLLLGLLQSLGKPLFVWNELIYHFEIFDIRGLVKGSIYLLTYLLAVVSLFVILSLKSFRLFLFFLIFLFLFFSIDLFIQLLGISHGFSYAEYSLAMNEIGNYKYLMAYTDMLLKSMGLAFLIVLFLYFIRLKVLKVKLSSAYLLFPLLSMVIIYFACLRIDTFKLSSYPSAIKIPNIALSYLQFSKPMKERILDINIKPKEAGQFQNIVWIIDESVTGSYLSVNGYAKNTTPYLNGLVKESQDFSNFGVVNSVSNCSANSNLFLRIGLNPHHHDKKERFSLPTIYQYAKRAGYKTWLFDSQTRKGHLQNYLTLYDRKSIDQFETLGADVTRIKRDEVALEHMSSIVNNSSSDRKNFIVLVKYGAHFPYLLTYDQKFTLFKPVLKSSYGGMNFEHKEEQLNTYLNSMYFNVDLYLKKMLKKIDLSKTVIFYTSDHGQNILESENLARPHCNDEKVVKNELSVPLFVFSKQAKIRFPKEREAFYSQIQIFPTTLSLLGYSDDLVSSYGKTLWEGYLNSNERKYMLSSSKEIKVYE